MESEKENKGGHQELPEGIKELVEIPGEKPTIQKFVVSIVVKA